MSNALPQPLRQAKRARASKPAQRCCARALSMLVLATIATGIASQALADAPPGRHALSTDTVRDNVTGLLWQRANGVSTSGQAAAISACMNLRLSGTGWRLPTRAELLSIIDIERSAPAVDSNAFPDTAAADYWSSSAYRGNPGSGWAVNFLDGEAHSLATSKLALVRCVR